MRLTDYASLGGHLESVVPLSEVLARPLKRVIQQDLVNPWPIGGKALLG
jgi:hypothetical protein